MSVNGESEALSYDHKPVNKGENARIVAAGGFVEFGRVNGKNHHRIDYHVMCLLRLQAILPFRAPWVTLSSSRTQA